MVDVVILHDADCVHLPLARAGVVEALQRSGVTAHVRELERGDAPAEWRGFASPTVLVAGRDVAEESACSGAACRIYLDAEGRPSGAPPVDRIVAALRRAS